MFCYISFKIRQSFFEIKEFLKNLLHIMDTCIVTRVIKRVSCNACHETRFIKRVSLNACHETRVIKRVSSNACHVTRFMERVSCDVCHETRVMKRVSCNACHNVAYYSFFNYDETKLLYFFLLSMLLITHITR